MSGKSGKIEKHAPTHFGFLLLNQFTLISLSAAIEPLRMANRIAGRRHYEWRILSETGAAVCASDGLTIQADADLHCRDSIARLDSVVVCGGMRIEQNYSRDTLKSLRQVAKRGLALGAICTGSHVLARAGLLDGYECSIHWENQATLIESCPKVHVTSNLFTIDRDRFTSSGGTAPIDMMLHIIAARLGPKVSAEIAEQFICDRIRRSDDRQRTPLRHLAGRHSGKLIAAVELMEANIKEPIDQADLAGYLGLSRRQLQRLFRKYLFLRAVALLHQPSPAQGTGAAATDQPQYPRGGFDVRIRFGVTFQQELQGLLRLFAESGTLTVSDETFARACRYRLGRVREGLRQAGCDAILLYDPVNIRYATETTNMQIWTMHNRARYALVFAAGPVILWEFHKCGHLHEGNALLDEIRPAINWSFFASGTRVAEKAKRWADDLAGVLKTHAGRRPRLAADYLHIEGSDGLRARGIDLADGESLMETARAIKSPDELSLMREAIVVCDAAVERMHQRLEPGMREIELWAVLHEANIRNGGQWIETRLLSSGPRTNPWMRECSSRRMREGELVCFDTDMIGPYGYCADMSRAWTVGHVPPTDAQRRLYCQAHEQIQHNSALLKDGVAFREFSENAWPIPERYYDNRYCYVAHGVGMADEHPSISHAGEDWGGGGHDGVFEAGMVISVESFVGETGGAEGVKLEQQLLITQDGTQTLTGFPWNDDWL